MSDHLIVDSSFSAVINAPHRTESTYRNGASRFQSMNIRAVRPPISPLASRPHRTGNANVDQRRGHRRLADDTALRGEAGPRRDHLVLESVSDIFTPTGRTTINILWELTAKAIDDDRSEFTNHVRSTATTEFLAFLERQGIPFDIFATQRQPMSIAHNRQETPLFAASIERAAWRN